MPQLSRVGYLLSSGITLGGGGGGLTTFTAPFLDTFDAPTGSIFNAVTPFRTTQGGTWASTAIAGTNTTALSVVTAGKLSGSVGTSPSNTFGNSSPTFTSTDWTSFRSLLSSISSTLGVSFTYSGANYTYLAITTASSIFRLTPIVNTVAGTNITFSNSFYQAGDTVQMRMSLNGSNVGAEFYVNGRVMRNSLSGDLNGVEVSPSFDLTAGSIPPGPPGARGNLPALALDEFETGDSTTKGMLSLLDPGRISQRESNGTVINRIGGTFTLGTPASLTYSAVDVATNTDISGHSGAAVQSYVPGTLSFTGKTAAITVPSPLTGYFIRAFRPDVVIAATPAIAQSSGAVHYPGEVMLLTGQSIMTKLWNATSGGTLTATNCWRIDAAYGENAAIPLVFPTAATRRYRQLAATTPLMDMAATYQTNGANVPMAFIMGGEGGTKISERVPGGTVPAHGIETYYQCEADGVQHAGGNFAWAYNVAGQFDYAAPDRGNYVSNFNTIMLAHQAAVGHAIKVIEEPITAIWGGTNADVEALRRIQTFQPINNTTITCYLGPYMLDQAQLDQYHFAATSNYAEEGRRAMWSRLKAEGYSTYDRTGPTLDSTTAPTFNLAAQTVAVTFNLGPFTSLSMRNDGGGALTTAAGALGGDHRGGMRFWVSTPGGTEKYPSSVSIGTPSGGKCVVTWTFPALSFVAAPFVGGPWGATPFNSFNNTTLRVAAQWNKVDGTGVNILEGVLSGEPNVAVAPYYNAAGNTDGSQDGVQSV